MKWVQRLFGQGLRAGEHTTARDEPVGLTGSDALATSPAPDLVDGINTLAAYYGYLEAEAYDAQIKIARERREFREDFLRRIDALLASQDNAEAKRQIQHQIDKEIAVFHTTLTFQPVTDVDAEARTRDAKGYSLLELSEPLTWESLKAAYRKSAKKYHSDAGGDNATMVRINDAYALFTAILRRTSARQAAADGQPLSMLGSVDNLFVKARFAKFAALVDDLAADTAYDTYKQQSLSDIERSYRGVDCVARLCELLAAARKPDDATRVLNDLHQIVERAAEHQLNYRPFFISAAEVCNKPNSARFVPNHIRQAKNLLRLQIIDQERYDAIMRRVGAAVEQVHEGQDAFLNYVRDYEFLSLPKDPIPDDNPINRLVPAPAYYSRVETLSPVQTREYARAFHGRSRELVFKYLAVRLDALLRAPFMFFTNIPAVLDELSFFATAPGLRSTLPYLCQQAIAVVTFLRDITPSEREERIHLLNSLDAVPGSPAVLTLTIDASADDVQSTCPRLTRPIFLNSQFTQFATGPLERIERYARTGSELTANEQQAETLTREERRLFQDSDVYTRAREVTWAKRAPPEQVAEAVAALCEAMYERIDKGDTSMDVGFWTNSLSVSLMKLHRFQEAADWIDRFQSASADLREKTTPSVVAALAKRRLRCAKALSSDT